MPGLCRPRPDVEARSALVPPGSCEMHTQLLRWRSVSAVNSRTINTSAASAIVLWFATANAALAERPSLEDGRKHWAFQPLNAAPAPAVKDAMWPRNDV